MAKINVVKKQVEGKTVYLTPSPLSGYLEISEEEVERGLADGTLQFYKPDPWAVEAVRRLGPDE